MPFSAEKEMVWQSEHQKFTLHTQIPLKGEMFPLVLVRQYLLEC